MRAYDPKRRGFVELTLASSLAALNRTPNTWMADGTYLRVNRQDGTAPTTSSTRACRGVYNLRVNSTMVSIALIGNTDADGWSFLGGPPAAGSVSYLPLQALPDPASQKCFVASNVTTQGGFHGFSINNTFGLVYLENCGGTGASEDIFNIHNNKTASATSSRSIPGRATPARLATSPARAGRSTTIPTAGPFSSAPTWTTPATA
jgi:hypothetical protein